jgi:hypothetical protein
MTDLQTIEALEQAPVKVKLSCGEFTVKPISIKRALRLIAMLKDVQGDPKRFRDAESPDFYRAVADTLLAAGEKLPEAVHLLTGDPELQKQDDFTLIDLSAIALAAAKANKASGIKSFFQQAKCEMTGEKPEQK